jgi:hypothetical protein
VIESYRLIVLYSIFYILYTLHTERARDDDLEYQVYGVHGSKYIYDGTQHTSYALQYYVLH